MFDERTQLRATMTEACRRLADLSGDAERKAFWLKRAGYWERLATNAAKRSPARKRKTALQWWGLPQKSASARGALLRIRRFNERLFQAVDFARTHQ